MQSYEKFRLKPDEKKFTKAVAVVKSDNDSKTGYETIPKSRCWS